MKKKLYVPHHLKNLFFGPLNLQKKNHVKLTTVYFFLTFWQ
jgi:hypothetical protein